MSDLKTRLEIADTLAEQGVSVSFQLMVKRHLADLFHATESEYMACPLCRRLWPKLIAACELHGFPITYTPAGAPKFPDEVLLDD